MIFKNGIDVKKLIYNFIDIFINWYMVFIIYDIYNIWYL